MAWTTNAFLEMYPQFKYAGAMLERALADSARQVDPNHYGDMTDEVVGLITAINLSASPYAQTQKQDGDEEKLTKYEARLAAIKLQKRVSFIVL